MLVTIPAASAYELKFAVDKLSSWLGIQVQEKKTPGDVVIICRGEDWKEVESKNTQQRCRGKLANLGEEGYVVLKNNQEKGIFVAGNTVGGTTNGIFDFLRLLQKENIKNPLSCQWDIKSKPYFEMRDVYHMPTFWDLAKLTVDSFTLEDWKEHLEFLRMVNTKRIILDIWGYHSYHPEHEETYRNEPRYQLWREAMQYAHKLGIKTGITFFPCVVPTFMFYKYPQYRAKEQHYWGTHLCWSRAKDLIFQFDKYFLEYFGNTIDRCLVEFMDPGECVCDLCLPNLSEVLLDIVDTYAPVAAKNTREGKLELNLWLLDQMEPQHPNLRIKLLDKIDRDTIIIDANRETLNMAAEREFRTGYFFFLLDPEDGTEFATIFPRPKIGLIDKQIKECQKYKDIGLTDYRLTPLTQFVGDYLFLRKCWDPNLENKEIVQELSAQVMKDKKDQDNFAKVVFFLEKWWTKRDFRSLQEAGSILSFLVSSDSYYPGRTKAIADCVDILILMEEYKDKGALHKDQLYEQLVDKVYDRMRESEIFRCYTADEHFVHRAKKMIAQRLKWWYGSEKRQKELFKMLEEVRFSDQIDSLS